MVQGGQCLGFALEAGEIIGVVGKGTGKDFNGDIAVEFVVARALNLAHAAFSERRENFVGTDSVAGGEGHLTDVIAPHSPLRCRPVRGGARHRRRGNCCRAGKRVISGLARRVFQLARRGWGHERNSPS